MGSGIRVRSTLDLSTGCMWIVSFTVWPLCPLERCLLSYRTQWSLQPRCMSWIKEILPVPGIEFLFFGQSGRSLLAIWTSYLSSSNFTVKFLHVFKNVYEYLLSTRRWHTESRIKIHYYLLIEVKLFVQWLYRKLLCKWQSCFEYQVFALRCLHKTPGLIFSFLTFKYVRIRWL